MKKFFRNLLSGYFLVLLLLLLEVAAIIVIQIFGDDIISYILSYFNLDKDLAGLFVVAGYLLFRLIVFIVHLPPSYLTEIRPFR